MKTKFIVSCLLTLCFFLSLTEVFAQSFNPSNLPNLSLWLRADSMLNVVGGKVTAWNDLSGNGFNAAQTNASLQPADSVAATLCNRHVVYFDGTNDKLDGVNIPNFAINSSTVFIVLAGGSNTVNNVGVFGTGSNTTGWMLMTDAVAGRFKVINNNATTNTASGTAPGAGFPYCLVTHTKEVGVVTQTYINGQPSGNPGVGGNFVTSILAGTNYSVGRTNYGNAFDGYVAEVIVYTSLLTASERQQVEQYIYNRYTCPLSLGADIVQPYSLCPVNLSAGSSFASYAWSTGATSSQISVNQSNSYSVTVTDVFGRISSDTVIVTMPAVRLNQSDTILCEGVVLNISSTLSGVSDYTDLWQDATTTDNYIASLAGEYFVQVTDSDNCSLRSDTITVAVDNFGSTVSLGPDVSICAGNTIQTIVPSSGSGSYTFAWSTGSSSAVLPITAGGNYAVTVSNSNSCSGADTINVTITGNAPSSVFTGANLCLGSAFIPVNTSAGNGSPITDYSWSFGNGDLNSVASPQYTYSVTGTYTVTLEVTNQDGCTATSSQNVVVKENPEAGFTAGAACVNNPFLFADASVSPAGETLTQWVWNFGDATTSNTQNPTHTYTTPNTYSVVLIVMASNSCSDTIAQNLPVVATASNASAPLLLSPPNGATTISPNINFSWNASSNVTNYTLEISTDNFTTTAQSFSNLTTTAYNLTVAGNQTYYWKVTAFNLCGSPSPSIISSFTVFSPADVNNLSLWLRADIGVTSNSGVVSAWADGSAFQLNCTQASVLAQPTLQPAVLLNNKPTIRFEGDDRLNGVEIPNFGIVSSTVFVVVGGDGNTVNNVGIFGTGSNTTGWMLLTDAVAGNFKVINNNTTTTTAPGSTLGISFPYRLFVHTKEIGDSSQSYINSQPSGDPGVGGAYVSPILGGTSYSVGRTNYGNAFKGNVAEIIVYTKLLSSVEQSQVENYLYSKYAPPVNLGADIFIDNSVCPIVLDAGNRFVDYLWSNGGTESTVSVTRSGYYSVRTIDVFNRVSRDTIYVSFPYLGMSSNDTAVCLGQSLSITPIMTSAGAFQYLWNDADATSTQTFSPSITGNYFAVISDGICTYNSDTVYALFDSLELRSLFSDTAVCSGNDLLADGGIYTAGNVLWNTGATTPAITITAPGVYSVDYTDVYGCNVKDTATVSIKGQAPTTDFTVSVSCLGDPVQFADASVPVGADNIVAWNWDFGDGQTTTGATAQNVFTNLQQYTVTHTVLTDSGCSGIETKTITVSPKPVAELTYTGVICAGTTAQFLDNSDVLITDNITQWKWTFNNVDVFTSQNPVYEFPQQGEVPVCLTVTTNNGCVDSMCGNIEVFAPLTANFSTQNFCMGDSVSFTDLTPSFSIVNWQWNFDDGSFFGNTQNTKHRYNAPGIYNVKLRIENSIGCSDTTSKNIQVMALPDAAFTNQNTCEDQFYSPLDNSVSLSEPIVNWKWNIGSANYSGQAVQHFFTDTGSYAVKLKVTTGSGCVDSTQQTVTIYPSPVAEFDFTPLYGEAPVDVTFNNLSTGATSYVWNFGDGNTSVDFEPNYTYTTNDTFTILLQSTSGFGCTDGASKTLVVIKTDLDLSLDKVKTIQTLQPDGSTLVTVVATISNVGTRTITHFQIYATLGDGALVSEEWNGTLFSGQIMDYVFSANFVVTAGNANTFVCAEAKSVNNGQTELRTDNNSNCASLTETLQLSGPSPNPAFNNSTLGIILPKAGKVQIAIADVTGRYAMKEYELSFAEGKNNFVLPIDELQAAEYFVRVRYNDETLVRKFVVR